GRTFTPADRGQRYVIGSEGSAATLGIGVGSVVTYRVNGQDMDFEVIGLAAQSLIGFSGGTIVPPGSLGSATPEFQFYTLQVEPRHVNEALVALSTIRLPPTFALDISLIDNVLQRFITQFAAIPTVVGILSLFAAAVIMANTVALATLERQRQIGILKSLGLKSRRVLTVMLIETGIIGLLSATLGIGLSSVFVTVITAASGTPIPLPDDARLVALALVIAAVVIAWGATFLSASVALRERVMNVLRYE
ncbi:MAG: FtsX-like permease family protein, partial [Anaerolineae bacterium]|nr:FtsX-like permease family protein [Anaerolineae bacterium]